MEERQSITSRANALVKSARALLQAKERKAACVHLIEGEKLVAEAVSSGARIEDLFVEEGFPAADCGARVHVVSRAVLESLCESKTPQHVCAIVQTPGTTAPAEYPDGLAVVLDGVQDPGNVGTIIRTADALGASCILLGTGCADPFSPKVLRASMGSVYHLPLYCGDAASELQKLRAQGFSCICGHLKGESVLPAPGQRAALVIGSEGSGVSDAVAAQCRLYRLPMRGHAESLNAAIAAALLLYELSNRMEV